MLLGTDNPKQRYFNGKKFVEFPRGKYEASEDEAKFLLKCAGVYLLASLKEGDLVVSPGGIEPLKKNEDKVKETNKESSESAPPPDDKDDKEDTLKEVLKGNAADVVAAIKLIDSEEALTALFGLEVAGQNRKIVTDTINEQIDNGL